MKGRADRNKVTFAELAGLFLNLLSRAHECVCVCVCVCARARTRLSRALAWWLLELKLQTGLILQPAWGPRACACPCMHDTWA